MSRRAAAFVATAGRNPKPVACASSTSQCGKMKITGEGSQRSLGLPVACAPRPLQGALRAQGSKVTCGQPTCCLTKLPHEVLRPTQDTRGQAGRGGRTREMKHGGEAAACHDSVPLAEDCRVPREVTATCGVWKSPSGLHVARSKSGRDGSMNVRCWRWRQGARIAIPDDKHKHPHTLQRTRCAMG